MAEARGAEAPWLAAARARIVATRAAGRMPHALLVQGPPGVGKSALADWIVRLLLCADPGAAACGRCTPCRLIDAGSHPDLFRVGVPDGKTQVPVEDVRTLIEALTLTSHRGGLKAAIVDPADALNTASANALLKTLEEPTAGTLLILTASRPERLPATIVSRCQRLKLPRPDTAAALKWLGTIDPAADWRAALALAGGGPLRALALADAAAIEREMGELPGLLSRPETDIVGLAERFQQRFPAERLRWIENWVTERIRRALAAPAPGHSPQNPSLPPTARTRHIPGLYAILDELRVAQTLLRGSANVTMLWERLLIGLARELGEVRAGLARGTHLAQGGQGQGYRQG